jgi:mannosyltransferase
MRARATFAGGRRAERILLAGAVVLAAVLRFTALDARGWWRDEAVTVRLLRLPFDELLRTIPDSEGSPPLYYVLAWVWTRLFGDSEVGLRSFSALVGTLTVVVVYLAGRDLVSKRTGIVAAYFTAVSPLLVWHAQDSRSYALLVLTGALSFLFFVRLRRTATQRDALGFGLVTALAVLTHYFAVFLVVPEVLWLLLASRTRRLTVAPAAIVAIVGIALMPLVAAQRGNVSWVSEVPRSRRLLEVVQELLVGPQAPWERSTTMLAGVLAAMALFVLGWRGNRDEWRAVLPAAAIGLAALILPLLVAFGGFDYLLGRNVIVAWVPLALVVAAGLTAQRAGRAGLAVACALIVLGIGVVVGSAATPKFGAEDWRGSARALGPSPARGRAIVLWPPEGADAFRLYRPTARLLPASGESVQEVMVVTLGDRRRNAALRAALAPPRPPFREVEREDAAHFSLARFTTARAFLATPDVLATPPAGVSRPAVLVER